MERAYEVDARRGEHDFNFKCKSANRAAGVGEGGTKSFSHCTYAHFYRGYRLSAILERVFSLSRSQHCDAASLVIVKMQRRYARAITARLAYRSGR